MITQVGNIVPNRRLLLAALLAASLVVHTGCESEAEREREAGQRVQSKTTIGADGSIHLTPEQVQASNIQTTESVAEEISPTVTLTGRVVPRSGGESEVFAPFPGLLVADPARVPRVGSFIQKGQTIAAVQQVFTASEQIQFRATEAQLAAAIEQAQGEVALNQKDLARSRQLYEGGAISLKQLQTAEFNLQQAQAKLEGARREKAQYDGVVASRGPGARPVAILAPISGVVTSADITPGQQVDTAKSLLAIVDLSTVWIEVAVHESELGVVRQASRAEFTTAANPGKVYTGTVVAVGSVVDPANRTVPVTFAVANPDGALKIGLFVQARAPTGTAVSAVLVPAGAVLAEEGQSFVYVETEPGVFKRKPVTTGERLGDLVAIADGLGAGEKVVSVGAAALRGESMRGQIPQGEEGEGAR